VIKANPLAKRVELRWQNIAEKKLPNLKYSHSNALMNDFVFANSQSNREGISRQSFLHAKVEGKEGV
jgi:hypothetical protein